MRKLLLPAICGVLAVTAGQLGAVPTYFFNDPVTARAAFDGAASGPLTLESFETPFNSSLSFPVGGPTAFTLSSSTPGGIVGQSSFSRGVTDGSFALAIDEDAPGMTLTFAFTRPIYAFGLDVNDLNFASMSFADNLGNANPNVLLGDNGGPAGGPGYENLQFFGVVNTDAFSAVQLTFVNPSTLTGTIFLDRLEYTSSVPESSSSLTLLALGILPVLGIRVWQRLAFR